MDLAAWGSSCQEGKHMMSPATNQDHVWQNRAEMALASTTSRGRVVTYAEMADAADIPAPQRIHKLTLWLEATMRQDHAAGQPLRAALVISRNRNGLPAPGFFLLCQELGIYQGAETGADAAQFHQTMLAALMRR
jgi:hypothetical protein